MGAGDPFTVTGRQATAGRCSFRYKYTISYNRARVYSELSGWVVNGLAVRFSAPVREK